MHKALSFALVALVACSKPEPPNALSTCTKLVSAGVAKDCQQVTPDGLGSTAKQAVNFQLPSVPGKGGQVLWFETEEGYAKVVKGFEIMADLAGPHRYGSAKARVFVQLTEATPADVGAKVKAVVDAL